MQSWDEKKQKLSNSDSAAGDAFQTISINQWCADLRLDFPLTSLLASATAFYTDFKISECIFHSASSPFISSGSSTNRPGYTSMTSHASIADRRSAGGRGGGVKNISKPPWIETFKCSDDDNTTKTGFTRFWTRTTMFTLQWSYSGYACSLLITWLKRFAVKDCSLNWIIFSQVNVLKWPWQPSWP